MAPCDRSFFIANFIANPPESQACRQVRKLHVEHVIVSHTSQGVQRCDASSPAITSEHPRRHLENQAVIQQCHLSNLRTHQQTGGVIGAAGSASPFAFSASFSRPYNSTVTASLCRMSTSGSLGRGRGDNDFDPFETACPIDHGAAGRASGGPSQASGRPQSDTGEMQTSPQNCARPGKTEQVR